MLGDDEPSFSVDYMVDQWRDKTRSVKVGRRKECVVRFRGARVVLRVQIGHQGTRQFLARTLGKASDRIPIREFGPDLKLPPCLKNASVSLLISNDACGATTSIRRSCGEKLDRTLKNEGRSSLGAIVSNVCSLSRARVHPFPALPWGVAG